MKKLKTRKAITKRIKVTATGKVKRLATGNRHLMLHKSKSRKRRLKKVRIEKMSMAPWKNIKSKIKKK